MADEHGIWYLADAAQSLGASIDNLPASSCADALVVSFTVGKTILYRIPAAFLYSKIYRQLKGEVRNDEDQLAGKGQLALF